MEEPLPAPADGSRPTLRRRTPGDRVTTIVPAESGASRTQEKLGLDQRMATLATALRRARVENAEHSAALADLRSAEIARLEILAEALSPVMAQVPQECDIFDVGVAPGDRPRLFIDQIGFVEMDRDKRTYRFLQDTRHGRIMLRESDDVDELVDAITNYIAHRLIEREKALAVDYASGGAVRSVRKTQTAADPNAGAMREKAFQVFLFFIEFLGSAAFFGLLAITGMWIYRTYFAQ
ncbi:MAG: hypothetical protein CTY15_07885 [Methylocystis sp.]|nr:MAG: hypothetical protein CTY15_07885 [Methylocystis sp.]